MNCPYCDKELEYHDHFGTDYFRNPKKAGDIYKCINADCEMYEEAFYTLLSEHNNVVHEGQPC